MKSVKGNRKRGNEKKKIKKGDIYKGIIVRTKMGKRNRKDGTSVKFEDNEVVLISKQENLVGNRVLGPMLREMRVGDKVSKQIASQAMKLI